MDLRSIQRVLWSLEQEKSLRGENPGAFPKAGPIFQQPFSLPENAQTLAGIAFGAAGKSVKNFPAASKFAGKLFQQGISDSHSLLEFLIIYILDGLAVAGSGPCRAGASVCLAIFFGACSEFQATVRRLKA